MTFVTAPDFETKSSYSFFATVTDSERASVQEVNITINNKGDLLSVADISVDEETPATLTATLDEVAASDITFNYAITSGTAERGSDYGDSGSESGTVTIPGGSSSATFTIDTGVPDTDDEENEFYIVTLSNASAPVTITDTTAQVTIIDNDSTVSVADASVNDGDRAETTVSIANVSPLEVRVDWIAYETGDTAQKALISQITYSGTAIIPAGSTSVTIGLETFVPDNLDEDDETFTITLSNPVNTAIGDATATITIIDDDESPIFDSSTRSISVDENQTAVGTVSLSDIVPLFTDGDGDTVTYSITGGADGGRFIINSTTGVLTFVTAPDYETKASYALTVTASDPYTNTDEQNITVNINDVGELISIADVTVDEEESAVFTVSLEAPAASDITLDYAAVAVTAERGSDYSDSVDTGSLTIPAGSSSINFTIYTGVPDTDDEETEYYDVVLSNANGATFADNTARVTIIDNDSAVSVADASVNDSETAVVTISIANTSPLDVSVDWIASQLPGDTAQRGSDFSDSTYSGTATIPAGSTSTTVSIETVIDDNLDEADETFTVTISNPVNAELGDSTATVTIIDDDESPVFTSSASLTADENQTAVDTVVATDGDGDTVTYSITGGADAASFAINSTTGVLTFVTAPDYETKASYALTVTADDNNPSRYGDSNKTTQDITVTIVDKGELISIADVTVDEEESAVFTVSLEAPAASDITLDYAAVAVTAERGSDYSDSVDTGSLTIPAGSSSINFCIYTGVPDTDDEETEYYDVVLSNANGATFADNTARVTIIDNDSAVSVADASVNDGDRAETTVSIANTSPLDVSVDWIASQEPGDTAQRGSDFSDSTYSGTATIPAGSTSVTIGLETFVPDNLDEADETFTITLSNPVNTAIGDATATITIIDDDESPVFTSSASLTADENQTAVDTVVATDGDGDTVTYSITGGADAASFAINSTTGVLTFVTAPDYETKASYAVTVTADDGYTNTAEQNITVTINNLNDNSPVITSAETFAVDENETSVGSLSATDADGDTVTFTLGGTDADSFSLNSPLEFVEAPDFETKSSYTITVIASDGTNTVEQEVTITINNLNDNVPVITSLDTFTIPENVTELTTLSATDADGDAFNLYIKRY